MKKFLCAAAATALLLASGASALAETGVPSRLVAAGPSGTVITCATIVHDHRYTGSTNYAISGSTTCGAPIQQSCTLTLPNQYPANTVTLSDSLFGTTCSLATGAEGENWSALQYRTVVTAPSGLLWVGAPNSCTGIGTATLDCTFSSPATPV